MKSCIRFLYSVENLSRCSSGKRGSYEYVFPADRISLRSVLEAFAGCSAVGDECIG